MPSRIEMIFPSLKKADAAEKITETSIARNDSSSSDSSEINIENAIATTGYFTYEEENRVLRKVDFRLLPFLILIYFCKNLDVNNISYVKIMNVDEPTNILTQLKMTSDEWAWTATAYYITFIVFEVPSTLLLKLTTPKIHQFRIAFLWGATVACQAAVKNKEGLLGLRAVLGLFEAGMFPGALAHLAYWYRPDEITTRMAFLGVLGSFSNVITAFITYGFAYANNKGGLTGWQWVFLIEGVFSMVAAFLALFFLPNFPNNAKWLTNEEKQYLIARLPKNSPKETDKNISWNEIKVSLLNPITWTFSFLKLFQYLGTYGLTFWLPSIVQSFGLSKGANSPLLSIPSSAISVISGIYFSYLADRSYFHPGFIVLASLTVSFASFIVLVQVTNKAVLYAFIIIATAAGSADGSITTSWMQPASKGSTGVGFTFAFSNSITQLAGVIGPQIFRAKYAPRYKLPYGICLMFIVLAGFMLAFCWYLTYHEESKQRHKRRQLLIEGKQNPKTAKPIYRDANRNGDVDTDF